MSSNPMNTYKTALNFISSFFAITTTNANRFGWSIGNKYTTYNVGDMIETALTKAPTNRTGLHGMSHGDATMTYNGKTYLVEIKAVSSSNSASKDRQGTTATHYVIFFYSSKGYELRMIEKNDLETDKENHITAKLNSSKGIKLDLNQISFQPVL